MCCRGEELSLKGRMSISNAAAPPFIPGFEAQSIIEHGRGIRVVLRRGMDYDLLHFPSACPRVELFPSLSIRRHCDEFVV